jgi:hypothetical protein
MSMTLIIVIAAAALLWYFWNQGQNGMGPLAGFMGTTS